MLNLAGALAGAGQDARLTPEILDPGRRAVIVHERRRFSLTLVCAGLDELCRHPGCDCPAPHPQIVFCDEHLADCNADTLTEMAHRWGLGQDLGDHPSRGEGSPEAELLARSAAAADACDRVITVLVDALFAQQEHDAPTSWSQEKEWALRDARERGRHRLTEICRAETHHIRRQTGQCATCDSPSARMRKPVSPHGSAPPPALCRRPARGRCPSPNVPRPRTDRHNPRTAGSAGTTRGHRTDTRKGYQRALLSLSG
ncbi:hypothetical protein [Streptomyces sp. NPDC051561]|uniref:hypothetical protein n=1 Tax=Streptomyces sp. NPDC051561 TaxID=3365658 RepID=UPI00379EE268